MRPSLAFMPARLEDEAMSMMILTQPIKGGGWVTLT